MARRRHRRRRGASGALAALAIFLALALAAYLGFRLRDAWSPAAQEGAPAAGESLSRPVPEAPTAQPPGEATKERPPAGRLALVIDDLGRSLADVDRLANLGVQVTGAVLPFEPQSEAVARSLEHRGFEVLCHLPMEPATAGVDPGPGALTRAMNTEQVRTATRRALAAVPGAVGANNHMGSAFSADAGSMRPVLEEIGGRGLLYLDSRTGAASVAFRLALALGIPSAERDVFLDGPGDGGSIERRWRELLAAARADGAAIAIGHPHETTLRFLERAVPSAVAEGYEFVPVSYLVDRPGDPPI